MSSQPISFADLSDEQLVAEVKRQHERDLAHGVGAVVLPYTLDRKYPNAATEWAWQFVFPASRVCRDARWGPPSRYHLHQSAVQRAVAEATRQAGVPKRVGAISTTMIYHARPQSRCIGSAKSGRSSVIGRRAWRLCASPGVAQAYGSFPTGWSYRTGHSQHQAVRKVRSATFCVDRTCQLDRRWKASRCWRSPLLHTPCICAFVRGHRHRYLFQVIVPWSMSHHSRRLFRCRRRCNSDGIRYDHRANCALHKHNQGCRLARRCTRRRHEHVLPDAIHRDWRRGCAVGVDLRTGMALTATPDDGTLIS